MYKERARKVFNKLINKELKDGEKLKKISSELNVSHTCIKLILNEQTFPGLELFCKFCEVYDVSLLTLKK